eukprot:3960026-Pyramimonas_sp.AAC.1
MRWLTGVNQQLRALDEPPGGRLTLGHSAREHAQVERSVAPTLAAICLQTGHKRASLRPSSQGYLGVLEFWGIKTRIVVLEAERRVDTGSGNTARMTTAALHSFQFKVRGFERVSTLRSYG